MSRQRLSVSFALCSGLFLSACMFGNSPAKLNQQINDGKPAKALTTIEDKLTSNPDDPALNLLAVKARLALCLQRNCVNETPGMAPALLAGLPKLTAHINGPVELAQDVSPLTVQEVFQQAMDQYQNASAQPAAVLAIYASAPANVKPVIADGLFKPALTLARRSDFTNTARNLTVISKSENLPTTYIYAAAMLAGQFGNLPELHEANFIALRSAENPPLPASAAALLPWALLAEAKSTSNTEPSTVLATLPKRLSDLKIPNLLNSKGMGNIARELVATSTNSNAASQWHANALTLQRMALTLDPNQPDLWTTYLPALVASVTKDPSSTKTNSDVPTPLPTVTLSSATAPRIATEVLKAAGQLINYPATATPLVMFASKIPLTKQQQIDLEKLSQSMLIKAAEQGDVTSTVVLATTLPGVAQNNRQSVVPMLVKYIRGNLREGNFEAATNTAELLTKTLQMDIEFAPIVLEEFTDDLKRRKIAESLNADTPDILLKPADSIVVDLGPIFTFMQSYFEDQPKVITAQLTTLVAQATGAYGQPTAMYRLGSYFPAETMSPEKQQEWLAASIEQSLLADTKLNAQQLADTAARMAIVHPTLNLAPVLEAAIKRAGSLEDQRSLWQNATPQVREVLRAIRPEFVLLMQGIDAMAENRLNTAAQSFASITEGEWRTAAKPFIEQFNEKLVTLSGVYVPVSAAPALKTAAILVAPSGLSGGKLNMVSLTFISRVGTMAENEPAAMRTNSAATHRFSLPVTYNFDNRSLAVTPQAVAQAPQGGIFGATYGNIRNLKLQGEDSTEAPLLNVTLADGSVTPFIRTLTDPAEPLRPDGTYTLQSRLGKTVSTTQNILPPGSLITFNTDNTVQPLPADTDIKTDSYVYPLTGTIRHPASAQPITFTGFFEPDTLTTTFTFSYPLPQSAQPARAAMRCQALAGPITCGTHNLNSARQAYAALITGLQTRESLTTSAAARNALNSLATSRLLLNATTPTTPVVSATTSTTTAPATINETLAAATLTTSSTSVSVTVASPSPTSLVSNLLPAPKLDDSETEAPAPAAAKTTPGTPEPGAFINHSGSNGTPSSTTPPAAPSKP